MLRRQIAGSGVISRHRPGPVRFPCIERSEIARAIFDIVAWIEHFLERSKTLAVELHVDLHAADVNQCDAGPLSFAYNAQGLRQIAGIARRALDVQSQRLQPVSSAGLRKRDGVEHGERNLESHGRAGHFTLASAPRNRDTVGADRAIRARGRDQNRDEYSPRRS